MLSELRVENLGVIADLSLVFGPGMTVLTGETGAGKTLVVEAIELLLGARADTSLVRSGADEARVEARFELTSDAVARLVELGRVDGRDGIDGIGGVDGGDGGEIVMARVVPSEGRSRAYLNGRLVPAGLLSEVGRQLVDLHGQHSHQALLTPAAQRAALDTFAGDDAGRALRNFRHARSRLIEIEDHLGSLGGDERERARENDLLRFQVDEIDAAAIDSVDEEERLLAEERVLADAEAHRAAADSAYSMLEGPILDRLGEVVERLADRPPMAELFDRLRVVQDEIGELARAARHLGEGIQENPERLETIQARRRLLGELRRKYGETLAEVLAYRDDAAKRLDELFDAETRARELETEARLARDEAQEAAERLSDARRAASAPLSRAIELGLRDLAMPAATFSVRVETHDRDGALPVDGFDDVEFLLSANAGEEPRPLARVASGGELARTMLAARVVLTEAPPTLVFDEVDAGIGGQAGVAVGRKLSVVARRHQVLCVTHLAQVAAFADAQVVVRKHEERGRTLAEVETVEGGERIDELSRMLAGMGTARARDHAEELLVTAAQERSG